MAASRGGPQRRGREAYQQEEGPLEYPPWDALPVVEGCDALAGAAHGRESDG